MLRSVLLLVVGLAGTAQANPIRTGTITVPVSPERIQDGVPPTIFLNRCTGGCTINRGLEDDNRTHTSRIPTGGNVFTMTEFAGTDDDWNAFVGCIREVFSPYAVTITDVQPPITEHYNEAIVAGFPQEIGVDPQFGGFAPIGEFCTVVPHAMSFTFANDFQGPNLVNDLCWIAAQEIGHTMGLDHQYELLDGTSACNDPMTYRFDCGGRKFFRNARARCGEDAVRPCICSAIQQSHPFLELRWGPGTPTTFPEVSIASPTPDSIIANGAVVHVPAGGGRGVFKVELYLNGYRWYELAGVPFGNNGQPVSTYQFALGADVPDGVIDIEAIAYDDIEVARSATVTVTKNAPCASADSCAEGQLCEEGRCFWETPTGQLGDSCSYPQFCESRSCQTVGGQSLCTQECVDALDMTCGDGFECRSEGFCWPLDTGGGCCDAGHGGPWAPFGAVLLGYLVLVRRRTR